MSKYRFENFDIKISPLGDGYRAAVVSSPGGEAQQDFRLPFQDTDLEMFVLRIGARRGKVRRIPTYEQSITKEWGAKLFSSLFSGEIGLCLHRSLTIANNKNVSLRIRLRLVDAPRLMDVPWEFLFDPSEDDYLAASRRTPIVRYLDVPKPVTPLDVAPPLRVLVAVSAPRGSVQLDARKEVASLRSALSQPIAKGTVVIEDMEAMTLDRLRVRLRNEDSPVHILHFIGHSHFDQQQSDGQLMLEDENGNLALTEAANFARVVCEHRPLRLVVLNSCEGARTATTDPFAGLAQTLLRKGVPGCLRCSLR